MALTKVKLIADGVIVQSNLDASHGITTADIGENASYLYYTDGRVSSYLSSNGYATQTDIVAAITDSAPATLDTLNELAAALGDDANFSTTVTNSIATKLPLAGGTLTGALTGTTASFNAGTTNVVATFTSTDGIAGIALVDNSGNVELSASGNTFQVQPAGGAAALSVTSTSATFGGNILFDGSGIISTNTSDGSDNAQLSLAGGGANSDGRGARIRLYGNEHASLAGVADLSTGNIAGSHMYLTASDSMILNTGGSEKMRIDSSGKVGIGTTTPSRKLHIVNTDDTRGILVENTLATSYAELHLKASREFRMGTGGVSSATEARDRFYIYDATAAAHRFTIDSSGKVGIGTTSPTYKFEVSNGTQTGTFNPNSSGFMFLGSTSNHSLYFGVNDSTKMVINTSGNVGIGTTSPTLNLDIASTNFGLPATSGTTPVGFQRWGYTNRNWGGNEILMGIINAGNYPGFIQCKVPTDYSGTRPFLINPQGGNVGIGTDSPATRLQVKDSQDSSFDSGISVVRSNAGSQVGYINMVGGAFNFNTISALPIKFRHGGNTDVTISGAGYVGIGTTAPSTPLDVIGIVRSYAASNNYAQLNNGSFQAVGNHGGTFMIDVDNNGTADLVNIKKSGSSRFYIQNGGNVGIGTTTPFATPSNNTGLNVDTGGHSSILIGDGVNDGGMVQSSDNSQRIIIGANVYDSPTGSWQRFTADSAALVDVYGEGSSAFISFNVDNGTSGFPTNRMHITNTGNVGIGTTSPSQKLEVSGVIKSISTGAAQLILNGDTNNSGDTGQEDAIIDFLGDGNPGIYGYRINTENFSGQTALHFQEYINGAYTSRLYINKDGNVGIGETSPGHKLDVYRDRIALTGLTAGTGGHYIALSGQLPGFTANQYNCLETNLNDLHFAAGGVYTGYISYNGGFTDVSDISLKENIEDIPNALNKVNNLRGRYFTWKNELQGNDKQIGFIAQEVEEYIPEVVTSGAGGTKGIAYGKITALLVNAIKELKADNDSLRARIEILENN